MVMIKYYHDLRLGAMPGENVKITIVDIRNIYKARLESGRDRSFWCFRRNKRWLPMPGNRPGYRQ
jgi:hypothetical protein